MASYVAKAVPAAAIYTTLGIAPNDMTANIRCINRDQVNAITIRIGISPAAVAPSAPAAADWIEPLDLVIPAGGILEEIGVAMASGEAVTVFNSAATATWRMYGR
jgi:hypothetical protein